MSDPILLKACKEGDLQIALDAIKHGATSWNWGMENACFGGHRDLVLLMIEKGATTWN